MVLSRIFQAVIEMFFSVVHYYVNSFYILSADMLFKILFFTEVCPNDIVYLEN